MLSFDIHGGRSPAGQTAPGGAPAVDRQPAVDAFSSRIFVPAASMA